MRLPAAGVTALSFTPDGLLLLSSGDPTQPQLPTAQSVAVAVMQGQMPCASGM